MLIWDYQESNINKFKNGFSKNIQVIYFVLELYVACKLRMYVAVFIMQWHYHTFTAAAKIAQWVNSKNKYNIKTTN